MHKLSGERWEGDSGCNRLSVSPTSLEGCCGSLQRETFWGLAPGDEGASFLKASKILGLRSGVTGPGEQGA